MIIQSESPDRFNTTSLSQICSSLLENCNSPNLF